MAQEIDNPADSAQPNPSRVVGDRLEELRTAADRMSAKGRLQGAAVLAIVLGVPAIHSASRGIEVNPLNYLFLGIGVCLTVLGTWAMRRPSVVHLAGIGLSLLAIGVWDIFISVYNSWLATKQDIPGTTDTGFQPFLLVFGIVYISIGVLELVRFGRYAGTIRTSTSAETNTRLDSLVAYVRQAPPEDTGDVVPLFVSTWVNHMEPWRAWLGDDAVMMMEQRGREILFARRGNMDIRRGKRSILRGRYQVSFRLDKRQIQGLTAPDVLERLEAWNADAQQEPACR